MLMQSDIGKLSRLDLMPLSAGTKLGAYSARHNRMTKNPAFGSLANGR
jgi:hypothetical protein